MKISKQFFGLLVAAVLCTQSIWVFGEGTPICNEEFPKTSKLCDTEKCKLSGTGCASTVSYTDPKSLNTECQGNSGDPRKHCVVEEVICSTKCGCVETDTGITNNPRYTCTAGGMVHNENGEEIHLMVDAAISKTCKKGS